MLGFLRQWFSSLPGGFCPRALTAAGVLELFAPWVLVPPVAAHGDHGPRDVTPALGLSGGGEVQSSSNPRATRIDPAEADGLAFHTVSLAPLANARLEQPDEWQDRTWKREMGQLPRGLQTFAGIPFRVIPPTENDGLAAVTLVGGRYKEGPSGGGSIAINRKADAIYLLHTASYQNRNLGRMMATYAGTYADGSRWEIPIRNKIEATDFMDHQNLTEDCVVGWSTRHPMFPNFYGVYVTRIRNPRPDKEIASFAFHPGNGSAVVSVLGLTVGDCTTSPLLTLEGVEWFERAEPVGEPRGRLELTVKADGAPAAARVFVVGPDGKAVQPLDGLNYIMLMRGKPFFYIDGKASLDVPAGTITVGVARGFEYRPVLLSLDVPEGKTVRHTLSLERWIDLPSQGWYSGEMHIHPFDQEPEDTSVCLLGEDLHVSNLLIWGNGFSLRYHGDQFFRGEPEPWPDSSHVAYYNEEFRNNTYGHLCLIDLRELVYPMGTGSEYRIEDYPANAVILDRTHEQGGFGSVAHMSVPPVDYAVPWEVSVDVALGKADSVDIDLKNFDRTKDRSLDLWYRLLNCGYSVPATCGTDAFMNRDWINMPLGNLRTYGYLGEDFSYKRWVDAARNGRSFVTQGPALLFTVEGQMPGDTLTLKKGKNPLRAHAEARSLYPLKRLELIVNGQVVASVGDGTTDTLTLDHVLELDGARSAWISARAEGQSSDFFLHPHLLAHTNPVHCKGQASFSSPTDAQFFVEEITGLLDWVEEKGRFDDPAHREEVKALFQKARERYRQQAGQED